MRELVLFKDKNPERQIMSNFITPAVLSEDMSGIKPLRIDDILFEKREIYLTTGVDAKSSAELIKLLNYLENDGTGETIKFYINSPGGSVPDGMAVYDFMSSMKTPITTICIGTAASMGAILFLAGKERIIMPNSEVMIHDPSFGSADFSGLKADEIMEKASDLMKTTRKLRSIVSERTGQDIKDVTKKMKKDSYFNADEAIEYGLATAKF